MKKYISIIFIICFLIPAAGIYAAPYLEKPDPERDAIDKARLDLITVAENYLGTPYRYGGLDEKGLDCSGLIYVCFRDALEIQVPRTTDKLYAFAEKIAYEELKPGDLVFFNTFGRNITHVGLYVGGGKFIHAPSEGAKRRVMYSTLTDSYWHRTYVAAGRILPWNGYTRDHFLRDEIPW